MATEGGRRAQFGPALSAFPSQPGAESNLFLQEIQAAHEAQFRLQSV